MNSINQSINNKKLLSKTVFRSCHLFFCQEEIPHKLSCLLISNNQIKKKFFSNKPLNCVFAKTSPFIQKEKFSQNDSQKTIFKKRVLASQKGFDFVKTNKKKEKVKIQFFWFHKKNIYSQNSKNFLYLNCWKTKWFYQKQYSILQSNLQFPHIISFQHLILQTFQKELVINDVRHKTKQIIKYLIQLYSSFHSLFTPFTSKRCRARRTELFTPNF
eukprot:TRINITY_DN130_c1_g2_i4.p2 TRINITY_DN130_c1_g2~~TRINITY_DN130_c1_g2_i4.p2  ORF type:complete len:215 (-),score=-5.85 TRINITY_DN130_c1_g2_i4:908-1552(-)